MQVTEFIVHRRNHAETTIQAKESPVNLGESEILFRIDSFAFTANNITYALVGEQVGYWQFFPVKKEGWGMIPVWGFADVAQSNHPQIQIGQRFYGYFPMASHLLVKAGEVREAGFADISVHRQALPPVYNFYFNTQTYTGYTPETEGIQSLFRPLFTTSFLIDDFLAESGFFGATQIVLTSASSKTAIALAFCLAARKKQSGATYQIIGLTSAGNMAFTADLGLYDTVVVYDKVNTVPAQNTVIVDFSGNNDVQYDLQIHLGGHLKYNCLVGLSHGEQDKSTAKQLPQKGILFFAPTYAQKRSKELGSTEFQQRIGQAWVAFLPQALSSLTIRQVAVQDWQRAYLETLAGKVNPDEGLIFSFGAK
jgi:hypothetical protein